MKKNDIFSAFEISVSSLIGIIGGVVVQKYFSASPQSWMYFTGVFLLTSTIIFSLSQYLTGYFRDNINFLRNKSQHFVEGHWIQIIEDERLQDLPPTKFSFIEIYRKDGELKIRGRSYNGTEGLQTTNFYSVAGTYDRNSNKLSYVYKFTTDENHEKKSLFGESVLVFGRYGNSKCANKYKGEVHSNLRDGVRVLAIRIDKSQNYNFSNQTSRQRVTSTIREAFLC